MIDETNLSDIAGEDSKSERRARLKSAMGEAGSDKRKSRQKIVGKLYRLLSSTPDDGTGMVDGTPFSLASVERLQTVLDERSSDEGKAGAKAAGRMKEFLKAGDDDAEAINGVSVSKLRWVANMGKRLEN